MHRRAAILPILLLLCAGTGSAQQELKVMTFNIRYAHSSPPNLWPDRRDEVRDAILTSEADLVGTQEGLYRQIVDMAADLPEYEWIGLGREGGSRGEFMAIFYRRDRFDPLEYDHFWLSDTPAEIGSRSWGNQIPRMVTWVRFRDRRTEREFYLVNTHFDHQSQPARERSAALLLERIAAFDAALPVVLTADFNADARENPVHAALTAPGALIDSWSATEGAEPAIGTFHNFRGPEQARGAGRIDWILTRGPIQARDTEIVTFERDGQYPSDHFPVVTELVYR